MEDRFEKRKHETTIVLCDNRKDGHKGKELKLAPLKTTTNEHTQKN